MDLVETIRLAAKAEAEGQRSEPIRQGEKALAIAKHALETFVSIAPDQSDRGAIALMNEDMVRAHQAKVEQIKTPSRR
ncbi:MAG: hypothetical protein EXQ58_05335 [Acidobacteria bacterium]|nr:hypothetical protein [Acidobacteriota bacterium]